MGDYKAPRAIDGGRRDVVASNPRVSPGGGGVGAEQRLDVLPAGRFRSEKRKIGGDARAGRLYERRVPARRKARLLFRKERKKLDDKNKGIKRRGSARLVYNDARRRGRDGDAQAPLSRVFRIMKDARLSGSNVHHVSGSLLRDLARFREKSVRSSSSRPRRRSLVSNPPIASRLTLS